VALGLSLLAVLGFLKMSGGQSDVEAMIASGGIEISKQEVIKVDRQIEVELENPEVLTSFIDDQGLMALEDQLQLIYGDYLPELVEVNTQIPNYYDNNSEMIFRRFAKEDLQSFQRLYKKAMKVADYDQCYLEINEASLSADDQKLYFELVVTYDYGMVMDYYVTIGLENLSLGLE